MGLFTKLFGAPQNVPVTVPLPESPEDRALAETAAKTCLHFLDKRTQKIARVHPLQLSSGVRAVLVEHTYNPGPSEHDAAMRGALAAQMGIAGVAAAGLRRFLHIQEYVVVIRAAPDATRDCAIGGTPVVAQHGELIAPGLWAVRGKANTNAADKLAPEPLLGALTAERGRVTFERRGEIVLVAMGPETDVSMGGGKVRNRLLRVAQEFGASN